MSTLRPLELFEIERDAEVGEICYKELKVPHVFNRSHFTQVWKAFYDQQVGVILVAEFHGTRQGYIGGCLYQDPFNGQTACQEFIWYIKPEYRSFTLARTMLLAFEEWAKERGATLMRISAPREKSEVGLLLTKAGYDKLEVVFERVL